MISLKWTKFPTAIKQNAKALCISFNVEMKTNELARSHVSQHLTYNFVY